MVGEVRRLGPEDWEVFREVRLEALADAPEAFGSTLAKEAGYGEERWRDWMRPDGGVKVVGVIDGEVVGVAGGWLPSEPEAVIELYGMWVDAPARGSGIARLLVEEVVAWAEEQGQAAVQLWVVTENGRAASLYENLGFVYTGRVQPSPRDAALTERLMVRFLR